MFTIKHTSKATGNTKVMSCDSYEKLSVNDLGLKLPQLTLNGGDKLLKVMLEYGDVVYVENVKGKTTDVIKAPAS